MTIKMLENITGNLTSDEVDNEKRTNLMFKLDDDFESGVRQASSNMQLSLAMEYAVRYLDALRDSVNAITDVVESLHAEIATLSNDNVQQRKTSKAKSSSVE